MFLLIILACSEPAKAPTITLVRGGAIVEAQVEGGQPLTGGRTFVAHAWSPGQPVALGGGLTTAPQLPGCVVLFSVLLGDASRVVARGGESPDTTLAFSPDGSRLAIGTWLGDVWIVDGWTGAVIARRHLAEAMVKAVAWSTDGAVLWAAEQSPEAMLYALNPADLEAKARYRLADDVEPSPPPAGDDLYGAYALPGAYSLHAEGADQVVVVAAHGWNTEAGRKNRSRVLRLRLVGDSLAVLAAFPAAGPADAVFGARVTDTAGRSAIPVRRSADGDAPVDLPIGGVQLLDVSLAPAGSVVLEPLRPWFEQAFIWEGLALLPDTLVIGAGDGRLVARGAELAQSIDLGTPIFAGDIPIAASVGFVGASGSDVLAVTARGDIPYGAASPDATPPRAHHNENALHAFELGPAGLTPHFSWRGPHELSGLLVSGGEAVVGAGPRRSDSRTDLFGVLRFDLGSVSPDQPVFCATEGPVFFRFARTTDGRVALGEVPWRDGPQVRGEYRATVVR